MQQFKALLKKELGSYFRSYFAYLVFAIYLFVSAGAACYFGSYLAIRDTTMFALFYLQPIILLFIIPALTMKSWSEEYKSGTAEFLLTQPVDDFKIVIAKVAASFLVCALMSLGLLPQIIYTGTWLQLDSGNIFCCFIGLWLLELMLCSLGCLLSSFSKHTIVSYVVSVFAMALLFIVRATKLYETFDNFLFGEVGLADLCYFSMFSIAFIWLNIQVLIYKRDIQKNKVLKLCVFSFLLFTGVGLSIAVVNLVFEYKFDFTSAGIYTPTDQSAQIVSQLEEPYSFEIYIAKDYKNHSPEYYHYYGQVKRILGKYQSLSKGMLTVRAIEVEPYSELENMILRNGLYYEENSNGTFDYFGAFLRNEASNGVVLKHFIAERRQFLEKDIDKALLKVIHPQLIKTVGVYMDATQNLDEFQGFMQNIESDFNTINVTSRTYEISPLLDMLILINPKNLPSYFIYAVDQYLVNGGKVIVFFDMLTENQTDVTNLETIQINKLFNNWGVMLHNSFSDNAELDHKFKTLNQTIRIKDAIAFNIKNDLMDVQPFLIDGDRYVGVLLNGNMTSAYRDNPFDKEQFPEPQGEHTKITLMPAKLALIGDVDIIEDYLWVDERSYSKNPFSVIAKNGNIEAIRNLMEDMLGISEYKSLPVRTETENKESIGQQINSYVNDKYADQYLKYINELQEKQQVLIDQSHGNVDRFNTLLQISKSGPQIAELEAKSNQLEYLMKRLYSQRVNKVIFLTVALFPLSAVGLLVLIMLFITSRQRKKIRRFLDE